MHVCVSNFALAALGLRWRGNRLFMPCGCKQIIKLIRHLVLLGLPLDCLLCMKGSGLGPPHCCTVSPRVGIKPVGHTASLSNSDLE